MALAQGARPAVGRRADARDAESQRQHGALRPRLLTGGHDVHAGPGDTAGRLIGPSGQMHDRFQPAGPDQPGQHAAQRAVTDQVGRRRRVQESECLNEHIGCLVAAQPAGEGHPRPGEPRRWLGGHVLAP